MQDIHSIGGGRLYSGGGDRRLRPHNQQSHQAVKCPRCDSTNTKFCYYNNYNLSQPRHFCKSCRRYWTKGGVLRNVPVGGGCRKTKRNSKPKPSSDSSAQQTQTQILAPASERERKSNSHNSSSESSSLTVTTNNTNVETVSVHSSSSVSNVLSMKNECKLFDNNSTNNKDDNNGGGFEGATTTTTLLEQVSDCGGIFSEIGSFTSLITSSSEPLSFGFSGLMNAQQGLESHHQWQQQQQLQEHQPKMVSGHMGGLQDHHTGLLDQTVQVELSELQDGSGNGGFGSLDWQGNGDQSLFDLPNAVDHASYWTHTTTQWTDYLP